MPVLNYYTLVRFRSRSFPSGWTRHRRQLLHATRLSSGSTSDRAHQGHPWTEKIARNPSRSLVISIFLALGLGWGYRRWHRSDEDTLKVDRYRPFQISDSKLLTQDTALLDLNVSLPALDPVKSLFYIESVYLKHPALQIERPYTPLSSITPTKNPEDGTRAAESNCIINVLVKRYPEGDMSTYLHHVKSPGNQVEVRGPVLTWHHQNDHEIDELVFIAAGTGITPAIQLLRRFFKTEARRNSRLPKFQLIYLAHSLESAYLLEELQIYQSNHPELMDLKLLINKEGESATPPPIKQLIHKVGHLEYSDIKKWVGTNEQGRRKMVIVCGPESLVCAVAGRKGRTYNSQGELGGMLKLLGYSSHQVVKL